MADKDMDNVRYSFEAQEFFQRQIEEAINTLINKNNTESDKAFSWFMNQENMSGIKDYSTTNLSNTTLNGISVAEGMLPSNLNNAIRALMVNTREWYNDAQWVQYGDGDGTYTPAFAATGQFTITATGLDLTPYYHANSKSCSRRYGSYHKFFIFKIRSIKT